jgi:signal transduction histidine kinase
MRAEPGSSSTIRVFLVDDDEVERLAIERLLKDEAEIQAHSFDSGEAALARIGVERCDCLLLDCETRLDGLALLDRLSKTEPSVPTILLTGAGDDTSAVGSNHGALDSIDKHALTGALLLTKIRAVRRLHEASERARVVERTLQELVERLRSEVLVRENLLGVVSHDLRGPLNNIGLAMNLIESDDPNLRATAIGSVRRALARAERLIGDLVDLTHILEPGFEIDRRQVGARGLVDAAVLDEQSAAQAKRVAVEIDIPEDLGDVYADRDRIIQVLGNLLRNALMHGPESGTIILAARTRGHDVVEFSVADEGLGSSPEARAHGLVFFWQSKDHNHATGSSLELAIARGIVMAHGGEIGVEPISGGARFWFTIPRTGGRGGDESRCAGVLVDERPVASGTVVPV